MASFLTLLTLISFFTCTFSQGGEDLGVGFYSTTCPNAEKIVASVVQQAVAANRNMAAILVRLHFHDCFVTGCDASILIDQGPTSERHAFGHQGVQGFDVIESAKAQLEAACPGVVSCADIVALAARDSIALSNGPAYEVPTGRKDGRVSNVSLASDMPEVGESVEQFKAKFLRKGLSTKDFVLLTAAHTIGTTACFFMTDRLYKFPTFGSDPTINTAFLPELKAKCPENGDVNVRLGIDHNSEGIFDDQILRNIKNGFAVLASDAKLYTDEETKDVIDSYIGGLSFLFGPSFVNDFAESMVKMGRIGVKTGDQGEIRRVCKAFN
ncbi:peroxidase [Ranunculus cassubicifolius]